MLLDLTFIESVLLYFKALLLLQEHLCKEVLGALSLFPGVMESFKGFFARLFLLDLLLLLGLFPLLLKLVHFIDIKKLSLELGEWKLVQRLFLDSPDIAVVLYNLLPGILLAFVAEEASHVVAKVVLEVNQNVSGQQLLGGGCLVVDHVCTLLNSLIHAGLTLGRDHL